MSAGGDGDLTPSWAAEPVVAPGRRAASARPWTLVAAVGLAVVETVAELVHVAGRDELTPGLRGFLLVVVASKLALAHGALRLSSAAAMGLLLFEGTAFVAAAVGGLGDAGRLALAVTAAAVMALLAASLHAFPRPQLPPIPGGQQ